MRQDLLDTSDQNSSRRGALVRVMAAALIVLGIASIAFLVQPEASRPTTGDFGTASVVNLVDANRGAETSAPATATDAAAQSAAPQRFERSNEPAEQEDSSNPHGG